MLISNSLNVIHCKIEFLISIAFELPCVLTNNPFSPNNGAPPCSSKENPLRVFFKSFLIKSAPIFVLIEFIIEPLILSIKTLATPSYNLRITLPTKASQTITSASPLGMSLASILPIKLMPSISFNSEYVSLTKAFPFSSSAPILTSATFGFFTPTTFSI